MAIIPVNQVSSVGDGKDAVFPFKGLDLIVLTALDMDVGTHAFVLEKIGIFLILSFKRDTEKSREGSARQILGGPDRLKTY